MSDSQKKKEIADAFMEYFLKTGMKKTIIDDVAKELGMSKKTIYKYFPSGKEDALRYYFQYEAEIKIKQLKSDLESIPLVKNKFKRVIKHIYEISRPAVEQNVVTEENEYVIENEIVGSAFREVYQGIVEILIIEGIETGEFKKVDIELTLHLIYGMILESMKIIHQDKKRKVEDDVIDAILKILQ